MPVQTPAVSALATLVANQCAHPKSSVQQALNVARAAD